MEHFILQHFECGPGYRCVRRQCQPRSRKFWARDITVVCFSSNSTDVWEDTAWNLNFNDYYENRNMTKTVICSPCKMLTIFSSYWGYSKSTLVKINESLGNLIVQRHMACNFAFMFAYTWVLFLLLLSLLLFQFLICVSFHHFQRGEHRQLPYNSYKAHAKPETIKFWNNFCVLRKDNLIK